MAESLIGLYKSECVKHDGPWPDTDALELGTLNWVWWYNNTRLHAAIGYTTPVRYENAYYHRHNNPRHQPVSGEPALHQTQGDSLSGQRGYSHYFDGVHPQRIPALNQGSPRGRGLN